MKVSGEFYGWNFATAQETNDPKKADIFPTFIDKKKKGRIEIRTFGKGGIQFVTKEQLGIDGQFLSYADEAPLSGYKSTAVLDFESTGEIFFIRSRDGQHYAKFAFSPGSYFMQADKQIARDLQLRYVYNPNGDRDLYFEECC